MNIHSVHLDDKYWTDPEVFRPERHLNENGTAVVKTDHLLAFGAGEFSADKPLLVLGPQYYMLIF